MKQLILAAVIVCMVSPSWGKDNNRMVTYGYEDLGTCGAFVKENRSGISDINTAWLRGFMTATNKFVPGNENFFDGTDEDSIFLWIEQWCLKNPTSPFSRGLHLFLVTRGVQVE